MENKHGWEEKEIGKNRPSDSCSPTKHDYLKFNGFISVSCEGVVSYLLSVYKSQNKFNFNFVIKYNV